MLLPARWAQPGQVVTT